MKYKTHNVNTEETIKDEIENKIGVRPKEVKLAIYTQRISELDFENPLTVTQENQLKVVIKKDWDQDLIKE